jgi:DNA-directed RNA polymerase
MKIYSSPSKMKVKRVKTSILKSSKPVTIHIPTDQFDYVEMERGFMANFIHSFDAANIHLLIGIINNNYKKQNINLYTIHDCFASTSGEMPLIEDIVKQAFINLYFNKNYLELFHNNIINQIKANANIITNNNQDYLILEDETEIKINIPTLPDFN